MLSKRVLGAGIAVAMMLGLADAQAQWFVTPSGPGILYFGVEGGWTHLNNAEGRRFDDGFNVGARGGYEWGPLRFEEEFNFGTNQLRRWSIPGANLPVTGQRNRYAIMTNAIYDIPLGWIFSPHIGVGIGAVNLHDSIGLRPGSGLFGPTCAQSCTIASSSDWEFGYQGIAGIRYKIFPSLALDLDYRYLATTNPTFKFAPQFGGGKYKSEYGTHNVVASLTWLFAPPPPPPPQPVAYPPPPPPPPAPVVPRVRG
ncbi:MAG: porin family protein [Alphaproteobacteria bacterium]|nr:porin family protein [Alphaproteobacteria bacterium]